MNTRVDSTAAIKGPVPSRPDDRLRELAFSSSSLPVHVHDAPGLLQLDGPAVVVNPTASPVPLYPAGLLDRIAPMSAGRYQAVGLRSEAPVVVIGLDRLRQPSAEALNPGWQPLEALPACRRSRRPRACRCSARRATAWRRSPPARTSSPPACRRSRRSSGGSS